MPRVLVPPPYRGPTHGEGVVEVRAQTVAGCIAAVEERYPGFAELILAPDGRVHRIVKLFLNGELVDPTELEQPVSEGDSVEVVAAIAGG